jgi:geranylgeranyl diphosphate synthase type II
MKTEPFSDLKSYLGEKKAIVDQALEDWLPDAEGPAARVVEAMKYSVFAGGKRLRPILCMTGAEAVGGSALDVLPVACALELIHTYSLIHDDLPVMDDDDFRRGKPTSHKVFGEALALLAGDGLLTEAFGLMTSVPMRQRVPPHTLLRVTHLIAGAAGYGGMVGGQAVDIEQEGRSVDLPLVEFIHAHKTAALIRASVTAGAILGGADESRIEALAAFGDRIGLAFQISDDILDIEGDSEALGKQTGADERRGKITYPSVVGLTRSKEVQSDLVASAVACLSSFDDLADPLREIARYIIKRKK